MLESVAGAVRGPVNLDAEAAVLFAGVDVAILDRSQLLDVLRDTAAVDARTAALRQLVLARLAETYPPDRQGSYAAEEVASELNITPSTAQGKITVARELTGRLRDTWTQMAAGRVGEVKARMLAHAVANLTDAQTELVQQSVLARSDLPYRQFKDTVDHAVATWTSEQHTAAKRQAAAEARTVTYTPGDHDTATLTIRGPVIPVHATWAALDEHAKASRGPGDPRTLGNARFDSFGTLFLDDHDAWNHLKIHADITVPVTTLAGDTVPGTLAGHGPISAPAARRLANTAKNWQRVVYHPDTGHMIAAGTHRYQPGDIDALLTHAIEALPQAEARRFASTLLTRYVRARNTRCVAKGCGRRAVSCDTDHTIPYSRLGETSPANLRPLCRYHHRMKDNAHGWGLRHNNDDNSVTWSTPTGREYTEEPHDYRGP